MLMMELKGQSTKLGYYLSPIEISVMCKIDVVGYLLNRHVLQDWLMKWAVKGQTLEDFLAQHHCVEVQDPLVETNLAITVKHWVLMIDGSRTQKRTGAGIISSTQNRGFGKSKAN
ncbi:hypothetical protein L195_g034237 [Trifolium pratense]|uniref:Uncharacterized protein n=1 Tax=Trifolium pratense TaxID=57577 RepID=A0A2K3LI92_TRIPR|nr:hypothetical protein L195_g034237 [Trifolium pratense]